MTEDFQKKCVSITKEAREEAIRAFKNFYKLLDIDPEIFNHIYKTPMRAGKINDAYANAIYDPNQNIIIIDTNYIVDLVKQIYKNVNNNTLNNTVKLNLALTMVHEMIHANRTVMIEDGLNALNIEEKALEELIQYSQETKGHDLNQYRLLLSDVLSQTYAKQFTKYVPIKTKINKDGTYTVIAYNKETKNYNEFANQNFNTKINDKIDEFIKQREKERNSKKITDTIFKAKDELWVIDSYFTNKKNNNKLW